MTAVVIALLLFVVIGATLVLLRRDAALDRLVITTGAADGAYHELGRRISRVIEHETAVATEIVIEASGGSEDNAHRAAAGSCDLALVQADTPLPSTSRLVTRLYDETLHIVATPDGDAETTGVVPVEWLRGKRVFIGESGSGTRRIGERLLEFFGVEVVEVSTTRAAALEAIERNDPSIDAVFLLSAYPMTTAERLIGSGASLVSLADPADPLGPIHAFVLRYPIYRATVLPARSYANLPPVQSVSVAAMLVTAGDRLDDADVESITDALFDKRDTLAAALPPVFDEAFPAMRAFTERYDPAGELVPYHAGAERHYLRHKPSFLATHAESMSLLMGLIGVLVSTGLIAYQRFERAKKNRIDTYYVRVEALSREAQGAPAHELQRIRNELDLVRAEALRDLVQERVEANESFVIFQNFLQAEARSLEHRIEAAGR